MRALTHFSVRHDRRDPVVPGELEPDVEDGFAVAGHQLRGALAAIPGADRDADHERPAGDHAARDEGPARALTHRGSPRAGTS